VRTSLAIALIAYSAALPAQQFGTLFHSAKERELLDRQRRGEKVETDGRAVVEAREPVITGYVKRSDGKSTVFIDNQPFEVKGAKAEAHLQPRNVQSYVAPPPPPPALPPAAAEPALPKPGQKTPGSPSGT
jgi:hypothetical protein